MDVRVIDTRVLKTNSKDSKVVFFLQIHYGHWVWESIRSYEELSTLHSRITSKVKKDVPALPELTYDVDEMKNAFSAYFGEIGANQACDTYLLHFLGRASLTTECQPLEHLPTREGVLTIKELKAKFYCSIVGDTLYYFQSIVHERPCYLPAGLIPLQSSKVSTKGSSVLVESQIGNYELQCTTEAVAKEWQQSIQQSSDVVEEEETQEKELNAQQQRALTVMKEEFPNADEQVLLLFLRSKAFNPESAIALYRADCIWRDEMALDELKITSVYETLKTGKVLLADGVDKHGRKILLFRARLHDPNSDFLEFLMACVYLLERALDGCPASQQVIMINDLKGFEKQHNDFRMNKLILELVLAHYPDRFGAIYCVSAPWLFSVIFKVIKPWLGSDLVSRVHIFSGIHELKSIIDESQLLTDFGGKAKFSIEEWAQKRAEIEGVSLKDKTTHQFRNEEIVATYSDAPVSQTTGAGCIKHDWMKKQGGFVKKFNKRYCVLRGSILYYYKGKTDTKAEGVVPLRNATLSVDASSVFHIITMAGKDCVFQLMDKDRDWITTLEKAIVENGGRVGNINTIVDVDPFEAIGNPDFVFPASGNGVDKDILDFMFELYSLGEESSPPEGIHGKLLLDLILEKAKLADRAAAKEFALRLMKLNFIATPTGKLVIEDDDSELYCLSFHSSSNMLNTLLVAPTVCAQPAALVKSLFEQLKTAILNHQDEHGQIKADAVVKSRAFFDFLISLADLQRVNVAQLDTTSFFNIRTILLLHGQLVNRGNTQNTIGRFNLFNNTQYLIGGLRFSAADIGHGILRANAPAPESGSLPSHFDKRDPRAKLSVKKYDPRVILALFPGINIEPLHFSQNFETTVQQATTNFGNDHLQWDPPRLLASVMLTWTGVATPAAFLTEYQIGPSKSELSNANYVYVNVDWKKLGLQLAGAPKE